MLLVDHQEAQVLERDVLGQEAMGADHDVHAAAGESLDHRLLLLGAPKAREQLHARGKRAEPLAEGIEVLLREHRRRHQHGDLAAVGHRLEGRAQGHLGLAVAHVARDEPVHGARARHVGLDVLDRLHLVARLLEAEGRLEFALPRGVSGECGPLHHRPRGVEPEQLLGHRAERGAHRILDAPPGHPAEPVESGGAVGRAHVLGDQVQPLHGQVEPAAVGVFEQEEIGIAPVRRERAQAVVAGDAVHLVHDEVIGRQVGEGGDGGAPLERRPAEPPPLRAEDFLLGEDDQTERGELKARRALSDDHAEPLRAPERHARPGLELVLGQHAPEALRLPLVVHHEPHGEALPAPSADLGGHRP